MGRKRPDRLGIGLLLLVYLVLATAYSLATPVLEAPDEPSHFSFVRHLATGQGLPVQQADPARNPVGQEGSQPPLYYWLGSLLVAGLSPFPGLPDWPDHNPHVTFDRPDDRYPEVGNRNLYAHTDQERFPYRGGPLAVRLVRGLSIVLGAVAVLAVFLAARTLVPGTSRDVLALAAAALVGLNPQFLFIAGVINSDNAITASASLAFLAMARILVHGASPRRAGLLGLALGLALLSKISGLALLPLAGLTLAIDLWQRRKLPGTLQAGLVAFGLAAAIGGWWYGRNWLLYGDPLGWEMMLVATGAMRRAVPLDPLAALALLFEARATFWATFGWTNVPATPLVDHWFELLAVTSGLALGALLVRLWRRPVQHGLDLRPVALLLGVWALVWLISLVRWVMINAAAHQGRLLFPAAGAGAILVVLGLQALQPRRLAGPAFGVAIASLLGLAVAAPLMFIAPVYGRPATLAAMPADEAIRPSAVRFGEVVELLGHTLSTDQLDPGGRLELNLYWRLLARPDRNWSVFSYLLAVNDHRILGEVTSWPAQGRLPMKTLRPGDIVRDRLLLPVAPGVPPGQMALVEVGLFDPTVEGGPRLPVFERGGRPIGSSVMLTRVRIQPGPEPASPSVARRVDFGDEIRLLGYRLDPVAERPEAAAAGPADETLTLALYWQALRRPARDYTVFVHLVDADRRMVSQHDSHPRGGASPTSFWLPGETVVDAHQLRVPASRSGRFQLLVGLYHLESGERLPPRDEAGPALPDRAVVVTEVARP